MTLFPLVLPAQPGAGTGAPAYLAEFPPSARVLADMQGQDPLETLGHQVAALNRLRRMIEELSGNRRFRNQLTPAEQQLVKSYGTDSARLQQQAIATFDPKQNTLESPRAQWFFAEQRYQNSDELRDDLLKRYFSSDFRKLYLSTMNADAANLEAIREDDRARNFAAQHPSAQPSAWSRLSPTERAATVRICWIFGIALVLLLGREMLPFGVDGNPPFIRAGLRRYRLSTHAGVVRNYRAWVETTTTVTERINQWGQVLSSSSSTSSTHHETFDLVGDSSSLPVHLTGAGLAPADGDILSGMSATRRMRKKGDWILFRNHTQAGRVTVLRGTVAKILSMRGWIFVPLLVLAYQLGSATYLLLDWHVAPGLRGLVMAFLSLPVWMIMFAVVGSRRAKRFERREVPRLLPLLALPGGQ